MAKTTGPMMSLAASGQFGKTMVNGTWRGISYMRRYVTPANPNSDSQKATRGVFGWCNGVWKQMDPAGQAPWIAFAKGKPLTQRLHQKEPQQSSRHGRRPRHDTRADPDIPGCERLAGRARHRTADDMAHGLTVTITPPDVPEGWTVVKVHALVFVQANANSSKVYTSHYGHADADPVVGHLRRHRRSHLRMHRAGWNTPSRTVRRLTARRCRTRKSSLNPPRAMTSEAARRPPRGFFARAR